MLDKYYENIFFHLNPKGEGTPSSNIEIPTCSTQLCSSNAAIVQTVGSKVLYALQHWGEKECVEIRVSILNTEFSCYGDFKLDSGHYLNVFLSSTFMMLVKQLRKTSDPNSSLISSLGFTFTYNFDYKWPFITLPISLLLDLHHYIICKASLNVTKVCFLAFGLEVQI